MSIMMFTAFRIVCFTLSNFPEMSLCSCEISIFQVFKFLPIISIILLGAKGKNLC